MQKYCMYFNNPILAPVALITIINTWITSWSVFGQYLYFQIQDRQCWTWLIFRQGSGLFCRPGFRSYNFWKWVLPPTLTGNVCYSECIHESSTNKQYNTISMLRFHRKKRKFKEWKWENMQKALKAVKQVELAPEENNFSKFGQK